MKLDRKALDRLLSLDDDGLKQTMKKLVSEAGIDLGSFNISDNDIANIRNALSSASDDDLKRAGDQLSEYRRKRLGGKDEH